MNAKSYFTTEDAVREVPLLPLASLARGGGSWRPREVPPRAPGPPASPAVCRPSRGPNHVMLQPLPANLPVSVTFCPRTGLASPFLLGVEARRDLGALTPHRLTQCGTRGQARRRNTNSLLLAPWPGAWGRARRSCLTHGRVPPAPGPGSRAGRSYRVLRPPAP